jgi:hypothetical protein
LKVGKGSAPPTCITLLNFTYTAAPVSVEKAKAFLSAQRPAWNTTHGNVTRQEAGAVGSLTIVVADSSSACIDGGASYTTAIGCTAEFSLGDTSGPLVVQANGTQALYAPGMGLGLPSWQDDAHHNSVCGASSCVQYSCAAATGVQNPVCLQFLWSATTAGIYSTFLELRQPDLSGQKDLGPRFMWQVVVSPAARDTAKGWVAKSRVGSGPEFLKSEAGRSDAFPVVPRDRKCWPPPCIICGAIPERSCLILTEWTPCFSP